MTETTQDPQQVPPQPSAVSLFDQSGASANDFPVLKAFQEYLNAEQAKARKRMLGLSVFFVVLLVVVVVTFTLVVVAVINRNQSLNDRLLDIALRERPAPVQQPPVVVQPPVPQPATPAQAESSDAKVLKPLLEKIESLATALSKQAAQPAAPVVATPSPTALSESLEAIRLKEELRRQQDALQAERERIKAERQKLKEDRSKAILEQQRRRLYPEYYARQDALNAAAAAQAALPPPPPPKPAVAPLQTDVQPPPPAKAAPLPPAPKSAAGTNGAIDYFKDAEADDPELEDLLKKTRTAKRKDVPAPSAPAQPPKAAAAASTRTTAAPKTEILDVGKGDDDSIPWRINLPESK